MGRMSFVGVIALVTGALFACEDSTSGEPETPPGIVLDAGTDQDMPADGPDAGPRIKVTVTVVAGADPVASAPVVAHDLAGNMVSPVVRTGADGKIVVDAVPGGIVTVATGGEGKGERRVFTYVGVKDGDALLVRAQKVYPTIQVTVPGTAYPQGNVPYSVIVGGCVVSGGFNQLGIALPPPALLNIAPTSDCRGPGPFALVGLTGFHDDNQLDATWLENLPADAIQATLPGWQALDAKPTLTTPNVVTTSEGAAATSAMLTALRGGFVQQTIGCTALVGTSDHFCRSVSSLADAYQVDLTSTDLVTVDRPIRLTASLAKRITVSDAILVEDTAPTTPTTATHAFAFDRTNPSRPVFSWKSPLEGADGAIAELAWSEKTPGGKTRARWIIVLPPSGSTAPISAPSLPPEIAEGLAPADSTFVATIEVIETDLLADYDALRKAAADWHRPGGAVILPTNGAARTMRATIID